ncbi:MAG: DUF5915 domain-containing protein, partial [bacterium]
PEFLAILREELNVKEVLAGEADKLDTALTEELKQEGLFRELVRQINDLRKQNGLTIQDKVIFNYQTDSQELKAVMDKFSVEIKKATLSKELATGEIDDEEIKVGDYAIKIKLIK